MFSDTAPGVYPFWFWNGTMEENELTRQIKLMTENGCKGAVLHARTGNKIPYLSKRWFELIRHTCRCARKLNFKIWLYDEEGYPSGTAGGLVQKDRPDLYQQCLYFSKEAPEFRFNFQCEPFAPGVWLLRFPPLVDVFNPESIERFINITHETYRREIGEFFGNTVEVMYTDDESFLGAHIPGVVYSPYLARAWEERYQRSFTGLLEDFQKKPEVRRDYYSLARELFLKNFIEPQKRWCNANDLRLVGHLCGDEGPLHYAIRRHGSAMPYYKAEDIPSIDDFLCDLRDQRYCHEPFSYSHTRYLPLSGERTFPLLCYKLGQSAADQYANGKFSAETLTFLGWDVTPRFLHKQMLFELLMGVNLITHHAYYYTVDDETIKDCPPSYFFQQPSCEIFGKYNLVWTRIAALLSRGRSAAKHLLILPENILGLPTWEDFLTRFPGSGPCHDAETALLERILELERAHCDYHLCDEGLLSVQNGKIQVGAMRYDTYEVLSGVPLLAETETLLKNADGISPDNSPAPLLDIPEPEFLLKGNCCNGTMQYAVLNLSGCEKPLQITAPEPCAWYDPVSDTVVARGMTLPAGAVLPEGDIIMLLKLDFPAKDIPFEESRYAPLRKTAHLLWPDGELCWQGSWKGAVKRLRVETQWAGEFYINGRKAGSFYGTEYFRIREFCQSGENSFQIRLFRQAHSNGLVMEPAVTLDFE